MDDERKQVLTKLDKKSSIPKKESDNNTIVTTLNIKWKSVVKETKHESIQY